MTSVDLNALSMRSRVMQDVTNDYEDGGAPAEPDDLGASLRRKTLARRKSRSSMAHGGGASMMTKRRRRSSARFLQLGNGGDDDDDATVATMATNATLSSTIGGNGGGSSRRKTNLGELYQNVIRMNAENKINVNNTWSLSLIDHMDRFLKDDMHSHNAHHSSSSHGHHHGNEDDGRMNQTQPGSKVNFTRASCTLDASVKIYSYRVDDIHLTSYKVLANLNRSDTGKKSRKSQGGGDGADGSGDDSGKQKSSRKSSNVDTLERNMANINMQKLDSAFDIDPLFHKMSKAFDEGGAKGLLLANLAVGPKGCNIVFDSTLDDEKATQPTATNESNSNSNSNEGDEYRGPDEDKEEADPTCDGTIDISGFNTYLDGLLGGKSLESQPLVPQLAGLRGEYSQLEEEGFVDHNVKRNRYASSPEEENEADRSIHQEALERSRASAGAFGRSYSNDETMDDGSGEGTNMFSADDDFGGGFELGGDGDDDDDGFDDGDNAGGFDMFGGGADGVGGSLFTDGDHRFSSSSFQAVPAEAESSQASVLLDAIASGDISTSQSNYEYLNSQALEKLQHSNAWAGSMHWRKSSRRAAKLKATEEEDGTDSLPKGSQKKKKGRSKKDPSTVLVSFQSDIEVESLGDLLRKPPKGRKGVDPLQLSKAVRTKHSKADNLLPIDADVGVQQLSSLFLRPNVDVDDLKRSVSAPTKSVGFGGVEMMEWGGDDDVNNDGDYDGDFDDDDNGGGGFHFNDDNMNESKDDFTIEELEGVRKVEKIRVGYATVAKKVDVKKLKIELWEELEVALGKKQLRQDEEGGGNDDEAKEGTDDTVEDDDESRSETDPESAEYDDDMVDGEDMRTSKDALSFYDTVQDMQASQSQGDVTLPFYFICLLHLANEKGLALESKGLDDFVIRG